MASKVKVAVLGAGSLGQNHVRIYAELAAAGQVELTGIFDTNADTARKIAAKHGARTGRHGGGSAENRQRHDVMQREE